MGEPVLELHAIRKSFFGVKALDDVRLSAGAGEVVGLVGENGAGKTTLMNILGGVFPPDSGRMVLSGRDYRPHHPSDATRAGVAFIHQELNLFENLSVTDNLFIQGFPRLGGLPILDRSAARSRARALLEDLGATISPDERVGRLQPGERQLVEIARALSTGARIIIFDEPTTSLTARESRKLFEIVGRLRDSGRTIFYISHALEDVRRLADTIVVLRDGAVVERGPRQAFTVQRMIACMVGRELERLYPPRRSRPGEKAALELEAVSQPGIVKDISFELHEGEVLGIFGLMGSGRTELARIIFGLDPFESGRIDVPRGRSRGRSPSDRILQGVAFVTEDRRGEGLLMEGSVLDNMALVALRRFARAGLPGVVDRARLEEAVREMKDRLRISSGPIQREPARNLSGGNQQKTVIGKWLLLEPSVLILDEPTRGIDVAARFEIYGLIQDLAARGTGVLCISSELEELLGVCDRIIVLGNGEIQGEFAREEFKQEAILHAAFQGPPRGIGEEGAGEEAGS